MYRPGDKSSCDFGGDQLDGAGFLGIMGLERGYGIICSRVMEFAKGVGIQLPRLMGIGCTANVAVGLSGEAGWCLLAGGIGLDCIYRDFEEIRLS